MKAIDPSDARRSCFPGRDVSSEAIIDSAHCSGLGSIPPYALTRQPKCNLIDMLVRRYSGILRAMSASEGKGSVALQSSAVLTASIRLLAAGLALMIFDLPLTSR